MLRGEHDGVIAICCWILAAGLTTGCTRAEPRPTSVLGITDAEAEATAVRLASFLPPQVGEFQAEAPAMTTVQLEGGLISATRSYAKADRTLTVELRTGDVSAEMRTIAQDEEHAFMSDSPTYWRTVHLKGRRARIAEDREVVKSSVVHVNIGGKVAARLVVAPRAKAGESAALAEVLDFDGIERAGIAAPAAAPAHE